MQTSNELKAPNPIRETTGVTLSTKTASSNDVRIEVSRRQGLQAHIKMTLSSPALVWERQGGVNYLMKVDGKKKELSGRLSSGFCFFPAFTPVEVEADFHGDSHYAFASFNQLFDDQSPWNHLSKALVGFRHAELEQGFAAVCREAAASDGVFDLFAEGWAMQVRAYLTRMTNTPSRESAQVGALSRSNHNKVDEYLRAHLADVVRISDLASITQLGNRHFTRSFVKTFSQTPYNYVIALRIEKAKQELLNTHTSITEIALACGFTHAQHFTTAFHKVVGMSPSRYRIWHREF